MGMAKAKQAVKMPAAKSHGAKTSGTTNEYMNIGNDAKKSAEERTTRKMFMIAPVFHTRMGAP
jgi:hypothetical protein